MLLLDKNGRIRKASPAACDILHRGTRDEVGGDFFELVEENNRNRVMWDLSEMACGGRHEATWTLRLKTGQRERQPVRIRARNRLHRSEHAGIELRLEPKRS